MSTARTSSSQITHIRNGQLWKFRNTPVRFYVERGGLLMRTRVNQTLPDGTKVNRNNPLSIQLKQTLAQNPIDSSVLSIALGIALAGPKGRAVRIHETADGTYEVKFRYGRAPEACDITAAPISVLNAATLRTALSGLLRYEAALNRVKLGKPAANDEKLINAVRSSRRV